MLDLHCHILPGIDDGAVDLDMALDMARIAAADGIREIACSPHIYPGMYENDAVGIRAAVAALQAELDQRDIPLRLHANADVHLVPGLLDGLREGRVPTIAGSRYLLLEPSHHVAPPRFEESVFELMTAGYTVLITHPERLSWVEDQYEVFERISRRGAWMQITAGALTGRFGRRVKYWGERFVGDGHCMVLATDAHHPQRRPPLLAEAREAAATLVGADEAEHMVHTRPAGIIANTAPELLPPPLFATPGFTPGSHDTPRSGSALVRFLRGLRSSRA
ncbi:tyrosine-protein phosphatase [Novilysobacter antarcticus]|uniref:tyrosine-protein phosphatase n=1 Tax=Novilysobacter antarcticus TaxID=2862543 RepID=UPI001C99D7BB|nr:CpsB/CapC family capsule biosynthesis tyrosine phosphatase [Lysobacter antarcticus]